MIGMKRVRVAAMIVAGLLILSVLLLSIENGRKVSGVVLVLAALAYALCFSSDFENRGEELRDARLPFMVGTGCYLLASATLGELVLEIFDRWSRGDAGFGMLIFLRIVILPSSCIGFVASILVARMKLSSGVFLLLFHALMIALVALPMLMF